MLHRGCVVREHAYEFHSEQQSLRSRGFLDLSREEKGQIAGRGCMKMNKIW
jgi:hypothetical protein